MTWATPVSQAGSLFRAGSAHVLFPRKNVVVLIRESRLARLPRSRLEQPGYQQAGQSAFSYKQNERKQSMNRAKPAKRACLVYRAGPPHINVPTRIRHRWGRCQKWNNERRRTNTIFGSNNFENEIALFAELSPNPLVSRHLNKSQMQLFLIGSCVDDKIRLQFL